MKAYLAAVSAMALCVGLSACADFPEPQYPVVAPAAPAPQPAPAPAPAPVPAPTPAPAVTDDTPKAHPSTPVEQSTLPPAGGARAAPKPGAFLDRGLDVGRPSVTRALWRAGDDAQVYLAATHHRKAKAAPKADQDEDASITIGKGDTLASIARAHATTVDDLAKLNGLKSPYRLTAGQTLKLPGAAASDEAPSSQGKTEAKSKSASKTRSAPAKAETVTVAKGDTLASISRKSGQSIDALAKLNGLDKPYRLKIGQSIKLAAAEEDEESDTASSKTPAKAKSKAAPAEEPAEAPATSTITVRRKDSLQSLARQAHVSVAELARLNHLKKPYHVTRGQQIKLPDLPGASTSRALSARSDAVDDVLAAPTVVTAGKKDTLNSIAKKYGFSVDKLAKLNRLKKPYRIKRGQKIELPGRAAEERPVQTNATSYRVQAGDTLYSVARRFGTDSKTLAELNGMDAGEPLKAGRRIRLPGGAEDRIAPKPSRGATSSGEPGAPVPYSSLPNNPSTPSAPGLAPPSGSPPAASPQSLTNQIAPYRPTAPTAEAAAPGDAEVAAAGKGLFQWPVKGDILQRFGPLAGGQRSDGIDIGDASGTPVMAAAAGEVVYAGNSLPGFGNMVLLRHDGGWVTVYAHLASLDVKMRQTVNQGQTIGAVGQTGGVSQPQLHFEVRYAPSTKDKPRTIDPMLVLPQ